MNTIELKTGQTLSFDHYGDSDAIPVVFLHGLSSNRRVYNSLVSDMQGYVDDNRLQLYNIDLRGHGESSHATLDTYDAFSYAADIAELIQVQASKPAVIISESLGGVIGAALVSRIPELVRGLFMEDPPLFLGDPGRLAQSPVSSDFPHTITAVRELQARHAPISDYKALMTEVAAPDEIDDLCAGLERWDPLTMQAAVDGILWRGLQPLARIACPLTILRADPEEGAAFEAEDVEPMHAANPHARIQLMKGATHSIRSTTPDAYWAELTAFLSGIAT